MTTSRLQFFCSSTAFAGVLACAAPPGFAEDEIVVSALRAPALLSETGSSVSVITAKDIIERQYVFASDALRDAAGVSIAGNGAAGAAAAARIRGASSGQTLVVIDGVVANDASAPQGGFNFANLDAATIERIEILRGPQSLLYGADAIGGVIAITTRRNGTGGFLEGGSFGTARAGLSAGFERANGAFGRLALSGVTTGGISRAAAGSEKDGYRAGTATLAAGAPLFEHWRAEVTLRANHARSEIDGFPPPDFTLGDTEEIERTKDYLAAGKLIQSFRNFDGALTLAWNSLERENADDGVETFSGEGGRLTADYVGAYKFSDRLRLVAGAEAERTSADASGVDETAKAGALFAAIETKPFETVTLSLGGRRDEFSNFAGATTARASAVWRASADWRLRASWGEGFRAPSLFELNYDQFGIIPNPDLRPERATGFDAGVERLFGERGRFAATFFHTKVKDQIDFDFAGSGYFNIDETRSRGVEIEGEIEIAPQLSASAAYTFADAIDLSTGAQLLRQPKHRGTAVIAYAPVDRLSVAATLTVNGRENDAPAPNEGFVRLDLRAAYALTETLELYGRVENATDADYQDVSGYGEPGLAVYGGVRVRL